MRWLHGATDDPTHRLSGPSTGFLRRGNHDGAHSGSVFAAWSRYMWSMIARPNSLHVTHVAW